MKIYLVFPDLTRVEITHEYLFPSAGDIVTLNGEELEVTYYSFDYDKKEIEINTKF